MSTTQPELFAPPSSVEAAIADAERRGQRITPWVRFALQSWADRKVGIPKARPEWEQQIWEHVGVAPSICDCLYCQLPAVIFPPEEGAPTGYCICPCCSYPKQSGCTHKGTKQRAQASA